MPPIDLVTDFISLPHVDVAPEVHEADRGARSCRCRVSTVGDRESMLPAGMVCAKCRRGVQAALRHADGWQRRPWPNRGTDRIHSSSLAGQTCAGAGAPLTTTVSVSVPVCVPSLTVSVSVYVPAVVNVTLLAAAVAAENVTPVAGDGAPLICQRRRRTVVRCRAGERHRRARQRRSRVASGVDCRSCILRRRCAADRSPPPPPPPPHAARMNTALTLRTHLIPRMEKVPYRESRTRHVEHENASRATKILGAVRKSPGK